MGRGEPGEQGAVRPAGQARELPDGWTDALPSWPVDPKGVSTRAASGAVLNALAPVLPELWGGSADLAESNNTTMKGADSFGPVAAKTRHWNATPYGRTLHFGIREHAMGAILSGIVLHGPTRAYGGTFLQFSDYMRGAVRLAAVMGAPAIYVWTHDSIGLGEDGPTHQPVEHLAALRAIPGLAIVRPADGNETAYAWQATLEKQSEFASGPVGLALTRQNVPTLEGTTAEGVARGGYVLADADGDLQVIIMATGSEVQLAVKARELLQAEGIGTRVVSVPCLDWFEVQDAALHRVRVARGGHRPGVGRGRRRAALVALARLRRQAGVAGALRRLRRRRDPVPGVRLHPRGHRRRRQGIPGRGRQAGQHQHRAEHRAHGARRQRHRHGERIRHAERLKHHPSRRAIHHVHRPCEPTDRARPHQARKSHHDHTAEHRQPAWPTFPPPGFPSGWTICPGSGCSPAT